MSEVLETEMTEEIVEVGTTQTGILEFIATLDGLLDDARTYDVGDFDKKADLEVCYKAIKPALTEIGKSIKAFSKTLTEDVIVKRDVFGGTPEEREAKAADKLKKDIEKMEKLQASIEARKA